MNKCTTTRIYPWKKTIAGTFRRCGVLALLLWVTIMAQSQTREPVFSFAADGLSLQQAFRLIEQKGEVVINFNEEEVDAGKKISVRSMKGTASQVLQAVLQQTPYEFLRSSGAFIIRRRTVSPSSGKPAGPGRISGRVTDSESGQPVQGATIIIDRKTILSDAEGAFTLTVNSGTHEAYITSIGYEDKTVYDIEVEKDQVSNLPVPLQKTAGQLGTVVVVGYGQQRKKDITGSVTSVPKERLEMVPNLNLAQALQGAAAGITIQQTSGGAASGETMMIRGRKSILASNDPLLIVDGIPYGGQIRDINVNDVASMEILKDASAAAIYGSRGANGVILITTKQGAKGKPQIRYEGKFGMQEPTFIPHYMNGEEFYAFKQIREPGKTTASEQAMYDAGESTNWIDLALRNGQSHQHDLSVAGGFQQTKYYIGGSFLDVKGLAVTDNYQRFTTRINLDTKILPWITIGTHTQLSFDDRAGAPFNWTNVFNTNPLTPAYDEQGKLTIYPWDEFTDIGNPLEPINYKSMNKSYQLLSNNYAIVEAPWIKGLNYRINLGVRKRTGDIATYKGRNTRTGLESRGEANTERNLQDNLVLENILSYNRSFGDHTVFATAVYSYEKNTQSANILTASGFPNDVLTWYAAAQAALVIPEYLYNHTALISQMARLNYSWKSKYLFTVTARRDGYSGFGASQKWGTFPSYAIGWNISDEQFFPWKKVVSNLKLRASLGFNGNQAVNAYESISRLGEYNMVSGSTSLPGYIPSKLGQENLGWEKTRTLNLGMDFSLFSGRITGDLNIYKANTTDLLLNRAISPVHGITTITQNIGATENRGLELSLSTRNVEKGDFKWFSSFNISFIRNKIVALYGNRDAKGQETDDVANAWFIGQPIMVNYDYVWNGVWQTAEAEEAAKWGTKPGFVKLKDVDNNYELTASDRQVIGQRDPKTIWGFGNTFAWKNLSLYVFIHGLGGITKYNEMLLDAPTSSEARRNIMKKNWWTPENPTAEWYANAINADQMAGISARVYESASFMRVKDIAISYDLPAPVLNQAGIQKLRVYITGRNLFTSTDWRGMDPELNHGRGAIPLQKEFLVGLDLTF